MSSDDSLPPLPAIRKGMKRTPSGLIVPARMNDQRAFEDRLVDCLANDDREFLDGLSEHEKAVAVQIIREMADDPELESLTLKNLWEVDYWERPVTIEEFLGNPYYMGDYTKELYPAWWEDMKKVFAPGAHYVEWVFGGAIGVGKSTCAALAMQYIIYRNACLRDPHSYYNLLKGAAIVYGIFSVTKTQVQDVGYTKIKSYLDACPWFLEKYPRVANLESRIAFQKHKMEVRTGSREFHAIGQDILAFYMDEVNFMGGNSSGKEDQERALAIYNSAKTRLKSRFMRPGGGTAGMTFLISSKRSTASFLETHIKESQKDIREGYTYVSEYALWDVKDKRLFVLPKFNVEVGDRIYPGRILEPSDKPRDGARVIEVPGEYRSEFEKSVDQGLRDLAGVATYGMTPLFRDKSVIIAAEDTNRKHPFTRDEFTISLKDPTHIHTYLVPERLFTIRQSTYVMKVNPQAPRFWHLDIGLTGDSAGLSVCHVAGVKKADRIRPDGTFFVDQLPLIYVDFMLRIVPPRGSEIDLSKIRTFLINLRDMGMPLLKGSCDGYQSRDTMQILSKLKFETTLLSVDVNDDPYMMLRQSFQEGRMQSYHYEPVLLELSELEHDLDHRKVNHPERREDGSPGRKDVADSLCGAVWNCLTDHRAVKRVSDVLPNWKPLASGELANRIRMTASSGDLMWTNLDKERLAARRRR